MSVGRHNTSRGFVFEGVPKIGSPGKRKAVEEEEEEEEEEGLFNANAVNVEGSKRDRATLVWRRMNVRICCSLPGQRGSMVLGAGLECPATSLCDSVLRPLPSDSFAACQQNLLLFLLLFPLSLSCCLRFSGAREAQLPERQSPAQARDRE